MKHVVFTHQIHCPNNCHLKSIYVQYLIVSERYIFFLQSQSRKLGIVNSEFRNNDKPLIPQLSLEHIEYSESSYKKKQQSTLLHLQYYHVT